MKTSLSLLALGATLLVPAVAQAQPGLPPGVNPGVLNAAAQRARQTDILYWYTLLPPNIFGAFGDADRLELLQSESAVYDKNRGFIEVFVPGDANENDVEKLQVKLYETQQGLMIAVSQVVWNQPRVKSALAFFTMSNSGQLLDVTRQVFPFELTPSQPNATAGATTDDATTAPDNGNNNIENNNARKRSAPPVNAYLSRNETTISTGVPETDEVSDEYRWNGAVFSKIEARDEPRDEPREN